MHRFFTAVVLACVTACAVPGRAADDNSKDANRDRPMEDLEARLQEQRATAVRFRLALYLDELEKLKTRSATDDDAALRDAVTAEITAVNAAMRTLENIIRRQADPPGEDEVKKDETLAPAALAARRINRIVARFNDAKALARAAAPGTAASGAVPRSLTLKFEKATRNKDYSDSGPRSYWGKENAWALWSVPGLPPGEYEILLRYTGDAGTGGKAIIKLAGKRLEKEIPTGTKGSREQISAGTVIVKDQGVDLRVENGGLSKGAESLWTLDAVLIQPVGKRP